MDIEFRNVSGSRVGFISGNDIKDWNGNRVGMIVGNDIKDSYGNRVGALNGSDIKDSYGNRVGMIVGNDIKDTYGNRVGYPESGASQLEMAAAGLILFRLKPEAASAGNPVKTQSSSDSNRNSSQYESSAVSSGSIVDNLSQSLGQSLFANVDGDIALKYLETWKRMQESERESEEKKRQEEELQNFKNWQNKQPGRNGTFEEYTKGKEKEEERKRAREEAREKRRKVVRVYAMIFAVVAIVLLIMSAVFNEGEGVFGIIIMLITHIIFFIRKFFRDYMMGVYERFPLGIFFSLILQLIIIAIGFGISVSSDVNEVGIIFSVGGSVLLIASWFMAIFTKD
jgi:hypothetical protein